jgi:hypothetical protein
MYAGKQCAVAFGFAFCGDIFFVGCQRVIISS